MLQEVATQFMPHFLFIHARLDDTTWIWVSHDSISFICLLTVLACQVKNLSYYHECFNIFNIKLNIFIHITSFPSLTVTKVTFDIFIVMLAASLEESYTSAPL